MASKMLRDALTSVSPGTTTESEAASAKSRDGDIGGGDRRTGKAIDSIDSGTDFSPAARPDHSAQRKRAYLHQQRGAIPTT
jgi:hypothetical protein